MARSKDYNLGEFTFPRGWFMVAESAKVTDKPQGVRFFGQEFALYRGKDSGQPIDASGSLDGTAFSGPEELAQAVHDHPSVAACFARRLFRYAVGHEETSGEEAFVKYLADRQVGDGYRVRALMMAIAKSDAFRRTALAGSN